MSSASSLIQRRGGVSPRDKLPHRKANLQAQEQKRASYVMVYNDGGGTSDGQVMFEELVSQGALTKDSSGEYVGAGGFVREWDGCSSTVSGDGFMARLQTTHPHVHSLTLSPALAQIHTHRPDRDLRRPPVDVSQSPVRPPGRSAGLQRLLHGWGLDGIGLAPDRRCAFGHGSVRRHIARQRAPCILHPTYIYRWP
jgi:hypothetical protein